MSALRPSYIEALGLNWRDVQVTAAEEGEVYEELIWENGPPIPPKAEMDAWIKTETQARVWKAIQTERDRRKWGGVKVGTNWFHSDDSSRIQQLALVMMGAGIPAGLMWKTMGGTFVPMTQTLAAQIFGGTAAQDQALFALAEQKRAAMMALDQPETYTGILTGWPLTFGE